MIKFYKVKIVIEDKFNKYLMILWYNRSLPVKLGV